MTEKQKILRKIWKSIHEIVSLKNKLNAEYETRLLLKRLDLKTKTIKSEDAVVYEAKIKQIINSFASIWQALKSYPELQDRFTGEFYPELFSILKNRFFHDTSPVYTFVGYINCLDDTDFILSNEENDILFIPDPIVGYNDLYTFLLTDDEKEKLLNQPHPSNSEIRKIRNKKWVKLYSNDILDIINDGFEWYVKRFKEFSNE